VLGVRKKLFQTASPSPEWRNDGKLVDVWFAFHLPDLDDARAFAVWLDARGYTSAPGVVLHHNDKPRTGVTPLQARCVLALWTKDSVNDQQVQGDARTAGYNGKLIEVCVRKGAPLERYSDDALITFNRVDPNSDNPAWRALLARIRKHCGEPPKKPSEFSRYAPTALGAIACAASLGGVGWYAADQADLRERAIEEANRHLTEPAGMIEPALAEAAKRPSLTPTTDLALAAGGPTPLDYADFDRDTGTAPPPPQPVVAPVEATPLERDRVVQGPEQ